MIQRWALEERKVEDGVFLMTSSGLVSALSALELVNTWTPKQNAIVSKGGLTRRIRLKSRFRRVSQTLEINLQKRCLPPESRVKSLARK